MIRPGRLGSAGIARALCLVSVLAASACARSGGADPPPGEGATSAASAADERARPSRPLRMVSLSIQPGKPGAPAETIRVEIREDAATLDVSRTAHDGAELARATANLTASDSATLIRIVETSRLAEFEPQPRDGKAYDFGARRLRIELTSDDPAASATEVEWSGPLENGDGVDALAAALARLARASCPSVELAYFPGP